MQARPAATVHKNFREEVEDWKDDSLPVGREARRPEATQNSNCDCPASILDEKGKVFKLDVRETPEKTGENRRGKKIGRRRVSRGMPNPS